MTVSVDTSNTLGLVFSTVACKVWMSILSCSTSFWQSFELSKTSLNFLVVFSNLDFNSPTSVFNTKFDLQTFWYSVTFTSSCLYKKNASFLAFVSVPSLFRVSAFATFVPAESLFTDFFWMKVLTSLVVFTDSWIKELASGSSFTFHFQI